MKRQKAKPTKQRTRLVSIAARSFKPPSAYKLTEADKNIVERIAKKIRFYLEVINLPSTIAKSALSYEDMKMITWEMTWYEINHEHTGPNLYRVGAIMAAVLKCI